MIILPAQIKEKQPPRRLFPVDTDESESESEVESADDGDQEMVEEIEVEESDLEPTRICKAHGTPSVLLPRKKTSQASGMV